MQLRQIEVNFVEFVWIESVCVCLHVFMCLCSEKFSRCKTVSPANRNIFTSSPSVWIPAFILLVSLSWLVSLVHYWIKVGIMNILVMLLIFGGKVSVIHLVVWSYPWVFEDVFVMLKNIFLVCWLFITKFLEFYQITFLHLFQWSYIFVIYSVSMVYYTSWFLYVTKPCILGINLIDHGV